MYQKTIACIGISFKAHDIYVLWAVLLGQTGQASSSQLMLTSLIHRQNTNQIQTIHIHMRSKTE
jgi:hypothetical protein